MGRKRIIVTIIIGLTVVGVLISVVFLAGPLPALLFLLTLGAGVIGGRQLRLRGNTTNSADDTGPQTFHQNLTDLFDKSSVSMLLFNARNGAVIRANPAARRLLDRGGGCASVSHLDDLGIKLPWLELTRAGSPLPELLLPTADGQPGIRVALTVEAIPQTPDFIRLLVIKELLSDHTLIQMVTQSSQAIIVVKADLSVVSANEVAASLSGHAIADLQGLSLSSLLPGGELVDPARELARFFASGIPGLSSENLAGIQLLRSSGELVPVQARLSLAPLGTGAVALITITDEREQIWREQEHAMQLSLTALLRAARTVQDLADVATNHAAMLFGLARAALAIDQTGSGLWKVVSATGSWQTHVGRLIVGEVSQSADMNRLLQAGDWPGFLSDEAALVISADPLVAHNELVGVLWMGSQSPLTDSERRLLQSASTILGSAIRRAQWNERLEHSNQMLRHAYDETIAGLARALELRDHETEHHSERVADMSLAIARRLGGLSDDYLIMLWRGAMLHDLGKVGIPDAILHKNSPLTEAEWAVMRLHPELAHAALKDIEFLQEAILIPLSHHERWDGSGYPRGLKGEDIPLSARIFAVADVWDALTNDRPYRASMAPAEALKLIMAEAGKHFDSRVVAAFLDILAADRVPLTMQGGVAI